MDTSKTVHEWAMIGRVAMGQPIKSRNANKQPSSSQSHPSYAPTSSDEEVSVHVKAGIKMTFTVESQPKLSQTVIRTFKRQCIHLIQKSACFADIRTEIILPFLRHLLEEHNWTLGVDAVVMVQAMCRQGALPCAILNKYQNVITGIVLPEPGRRETFEPNEENITAFLRESFDNFLAQPGDLFEAKQLLEGDDVSVLRTCIIFLDALLDQIKNINHQVDYEAQMHQLASEPLLFSPVDAPSLRGSMISQGSEVRETVPLGNCTSLNKSSSISEAQYVADMETLQGYVKEIRLRRLIDPNRLTQAFGCLDAIVEVQNRLLMDLEGHYSANPEDVHPELVFQDYTEKLFEVYKEFLENHSLAENLLQSHTSVLLVLEHRFMHPQTAVQSYLVKPIQRICKYQILFEAIIKNTPKDQRASLIEGCRGQRSSQHVSMKLRWPRRTGSRMPASGWIPILCTRTVWGTC